ncbi:VanZ like family protein [Dyadobacter sp. SG02]|uniref:VanZ family protein n=1 Tax=Dyadobacter sp. SG02 TaxID=1855291 RepID=UPI0008C8DB73|nr:VanZ family protein [Dyadobacter sp. SG02]SEJ39281.1 VanZ like family protein [Dyadobacter sp. SG02]
MRHIFYPILALGAGIVLYLSWLPDPDIGFQPYFPEWLGKWTNANVNLRTAVPFALLGFTGDLFFQRSITDLRRKRARLLIALSLVVLTAEIGQVFLPKRHFDTGDILWGISGAATGIFAAMALTRVLRSASR